MLRHRLQISAPSILADGHVRPVRSGADRLVHAAAVLSFGFLLATVLLAVCYGAAVTVFWYVYGVRLPTPLG